jgi:hypothetical protein
MLATAALLLLQMPPGVASLRLVVEVTQRFVLPVMGSGTGFTRILVLITHPVPTVYTMVATPADTPVIMPLEVPAVAMDAGVLLHVPPGIALASVIVAPSQTSTGPVIAGGSGFTLTTMET